MVRIVSVLVPLVLALHGLIHLMGFAKGFGLLALPQLSRSISRPLGLAWLAAALLTLGAAAALPLAPRWGWAVAVAALFVSQAVIVVSWSDAKFGTLANLLLLAAAAYGYLAHGPTSLSAEYTRALAVAAPVPPGAPLTEADLAPLPAPVQRYIRASGALGQPRVHDFRAHWTGRIRAGADEPWMDFTAEQMNTLDPPRRFFFMDAVMKGLPVDVFHRFDEAGATMRVRLLSAVTMVDAAGPMMTRSETVTLFNDLCLFAPGELVRPSITWEAVDEHTARARYTQGPDTIAATLHFNDADALVDFESDDRSPDPEGKSGPMRWTTPISVYARVGPARVAQTAEVRWHPPAGAWTYGEFTLTDLAWNTAR
jgi:hypothetical protein